MDNDMGQFWKKISSLSGKATHVLQTHLTIVIGIQQGSEKITLINFLPDIKTWLRKESDQKHTPPTSQLDHTVRGAYGRENAWGRAARSHQPHRGQPHGGLQAKQSPVWW